MHFHSVLAFSHCSASFSFLRSSSTALFFDAFSQFLQFEVVLRLLNFALNLVVGRGGTVVPAAFVRGVSIVVVTHWAPPKRKRGRGRETTTGGAAFTRVF